MKVRNNHSKIPNISQDVSDVEASKLQSIFQRRGHQMTTPNCFASIFLPHFSTYAKFAHAKCPQDKNGILYLFVLTDTNTALEILQT